MSETLNREKVQAIADLIARRFGGVYTSKAALWDTALHIYDEHIAALAAALRRRTAEGFRVEVADVTNDAATLAELGALKAQHEAAMREIQHLTEERNTLREGLARATGDGALEYSLLADEVRELRGALADAQHEIEHWKEEAQRYAQNTDHWRVRAEHAETQARALRPIVKLLADLFDDPDARHIVLGWFDEEQIRQALATPPPAPTEPTP